MAKQTNAKTQQQPRNQKGKPSKAATRRKAQERRARQRRRDDRKGETQKKAEAKRINAPQGSGVLKNWKDKNSAEREAYNAHELPYANSAKARHLSSATLRYAATIADPTQDLSIVHPIVQPTYEAGMVAMERFRCNLTQTCSSSTNFSFTLVFPGTAGPYSDRWCAITTPGTYAGTSIGGGGVAAGTWIDTPYDTVSANEVTLSWRMTACVVRIRNVTPEMYRGGTIVVLESPGHELMFDGLDFDDISSYRGATIYDADIAEGEYIELLWHPQDVSPTQSAVTSHQLETGRSGLVGFNDYSIPLLGYTADLGGELAIACAHPSVLGTVQPQLLEVSIHGLYENRGSSVRGKSLYRREADGMAVMDAALTDLSSRSGSVDSAKTWHDQGAGPVSSTVGRYVKTAVELAQAAAPIATDVLALLGAVP